VEIKSLAGQGIAALLHEQHRGKKDRQATSYESEQPLVPKPLAASKRKSSTIGLLFSLIGTCAKLMKSGVKTLIESFTVSNAIKLFILSQILPIFLKYGKETNTAGVAVYRPPPRQHFTFEAISYSESTTLPARKNTKVGSASENDQYGGHFSLDKKALRREINFQRKVRYSFDRNTAKSIEAKVGDIAELLQRKPNSSNMSDEWSPVDEFAEFSTVNRVLSSCSNNCS